MITEKGHLNYVHLQKVQDEEYNHVDPSYMECTPVDSCMKLCGHFEIDVFHCKNSLAIEMVEFSVIELMY